MWSSLTAAYEALSEPMKAFLQGLALHDALLIAQQDDDPSGHSSPPEVACPRSM